MVLEYTFVNAIMVACYLVGTSDIHAFKQLRSALNMDIYNEAHDE